MTPNNPDAEKSDPAIEPTMRLQRALAAAGIASRRQCEQIILEGRVDVDGATITTLGTKVDPQRQKITVDGQPIRVRRHVYYVLNKPPGVLSTSHDESGRLRAIDLIDSRERVYTVGRLDKSSEGLIVITNDGDLANQLTHPRYGVEKTYLVRVVGQPTQEHLQRLRAGIHLAEAFAKVAEVRVKKQMQNCTDLEIILREGKNREIRRVMASLGHKVVSLKRIAIGPIRLGEMPRGTYRELTREEIMALRAAGAPASDKRPRRRPKSPAGGRRHAKFSSRSLREGRFGVKAPSPATGRPRKLGRTKSGPPRDRSKRTTRSPHRAAPPAARGNTRRVRGKSHRRPS